MLLAIIISRRAPGLNFGIQTDWYISEKLMEKRFKPLADYLAEEIGMPINIRQVLEENKIIEELGRGTIDIAYVSPSVYIQGHFKYGVRPILAALNAGSPTYKCIIAACKDSDIDKIEDIRGRSFAFGHRLSESTWLIPRAMLADAGIRLEELREHACLGTDPDVAMAIINKRFDAGAVKEAIAHRFKNKGLKFIKISAAFPEYMICVNKDFDPRLAEKIVNAILRLDYDHPGYRKILTSVEPYFTGFVRARDENYEVVRQMHKIVYGFDYHKE